MANEKRLIDANVLIEDLEAAEANAGMGAVVARTLIRYVKRCATVDAVEVVHGRWVRKAHDGAFGVFHLWHCSVCDTIRARQDPYCGECGAKMEVDNG